MKKINLVIMLVGFVSLSRAQGVQHDNPLATPLDCLVHRAANVYMKSGPRVGLSIGVIKNGRPYTYNYGTTDKSTDQLPTANSVYELASITKTFAAALLARAVVEKRVKLEDDIRVYLDGDYPNLAYTGVPVKLINLANLTSGLPNWMPDNKALFSKTDPDSIPQLLDAIHRKYKRSDLYRDLHQVQLDTLPGTVTKHCNTAAQLLGYIMERVYKAPMQQLVMTYFTKPLKMHHTAYLSEEVHNPTLVKGYDARGNLMPSITWEDLQVAASLSSCTADMLQYMAYQIKESGRDVQLSHTPTNGQPENGAIALNWKINLTADHQRRISHTGGSLGFSTYMVFYPGSKDGIVLLSNEADPAAQGALIELADAVIRH